ncbi:putative U3 small nucleolar RNA-associated protein 25 [Venustampulla echinocandica]|uniref:U3 small nucleolar RNA-associated protein 25 n=1 Tax=Venustampulla echinocandica TaxID=2656787 RepID=A0A370TQU1_9HELO|nr:putative U3 small nucleolar RNA-associated protein 25 [Venustampulla echinocandica]RDL37878.1 putative U3 small nucleolar RNA-associated protein 25 [Venustampulla echinocandica]
MAFHGNRGGSRGRGSGSSGSRGRGRGGGGVRGGGGGGGRGRGGGGFRAKRPVFDSARIAKQEEANAGQDSESENPSEEEDDKSPSEDESTDEEDEPLPAVRPYSALIQSLAAGSAPQAKRRKLDHPQPGKPAETVSDDSSERLEKLSDETDDVDEEEEGPDTTADALLDDDEEEDSEDSLDPFEVHFANPDGNLLSQKLKALQLNQWATQKLILPKVGKAVFSTPQEVDQKTVALAPSVSSPADLKLKLKLAGAVAKQWPEFNHMEKSIAAYMFNYQDILYCERKPSNSEELRRLTCLHAVNHVFKTRDRVIKNNARLAKEGSDDLELRDQGFTRPKVLMILPTRQSCCRMIDAITSICPPEQQENRKRFEDSYVEKGEKFSADKPEDFSELFEGNDDDMFRLGLKFTRKTIKYFSQFYNSDIIFASPLGLRMALEGKDDKKGDYDFLSSIEMIIVDQADALLMQNWEHVEYIFEHLNMQPKEAHGCDFSRVRSWYLDNNAKYFRQVIALAGFNTPELNTLFYNQSTNWAGKVKISDTYSGAIQELGLKIKQTFSRLESPSFATDPDARFTYFTSAIIPSLTRRAKDTAGTLMFIPSYLDFVRVRNYLSTSTTTSSLSFGSISEYTSVRDVARARSHFFTGRHSVLLYTERAHHFRRYQVRGVRKVIMYGLPDNPVFYKEIVAGYLGRSVQEGKLAPGEGSVRAIFSKWDVLKLERIAGTERVGKMLRDKGDTFDFL